ncbi:MAG TPA: transposase [Alphaproteobacteria bacterium]|nr:transposase [Alphaproteobacteria bacterium]
MVPTTGERFFLARPHLHAEMFQIFMEAFANAFPERLNLLLLDHSGAHTARRLRWPEHVRPVWLPPYCPELNPMERVWRDLKDDVAWQQFSDLDAQQDRLSPLLQAFEADTLPSLTGYPDLVEAIDALDV